MSQHTNATPKPGPKPRLRLGLSTPGLRRHKKQINEETETPRATMSLPLKANSTSCKRPGLRRPRKELTKKRLQFVKAEETITREVEKDTEPATSSKGSRITELEKDIEIWRNAFAASMDDLQSSLQPPQSKKNLLIQLGIPLEMLPYLDED